MNIGDTIEYYNVYDEKKSGVITEVFSDMDSYEDMRLEDGIPMYYSKKLSHFVPVKEKIWPLCFLLWKGLGIQKSL